jgi:hypothetical protein
LNHFELPELGLWNFLVPEAFALKLYIYKIFGHFLAPQNLNLLVSEKL